MLVYVEQEGLTPLHCAASHGHKDCVSLLLVKGADKEAGDTVSHPHCALYTFRDDTHPARHAYSHDAPLCIHADMYMHANI
jgi:hypothetical protein